MKQEIKMGAFEANVEQFYQELWHEILPYMRKHRTGDVENKIFNGICDMLEENQQHWVWNQIDTDLSTEDSVYESVQYLVKKLTPYNYQLWKPVHNNYGEVIDWDVKELIKDKIVKPKWKKTKTYRTSNGILVRYSTKNDIALKGLTTKGLIMSIEDYQTFSNDTKMNLDTLTPQQLERLITDLEMNLHPKFWKQYPTLKSYDESVLIEKGIEEKNTKEEELSYQVGRGFKNMNEEKVDWKSVEDTFDALGNTSGIFDN